MYHRQFRPVESSANACSRLSVWFAIFTVLFRCPSTPQSLTNDSPGVCKHYFTARTYVQPYVEPYYDAYASRYVDKAQPYVSAANDRVVKPASSLVLQNYQTFAAPQVTKAKTYARAQWEKYALPQLRRAQESAQHAYDETLAPQVLRVSEVATPYYETAKENAVNAHEKHIIPAIAYSQPHIYKVYAALHRFVLEKAVPFGQHAWKNLIIFVDGTLWPFVKKVYGDNVRPQLVMIGERIAKYQEGRKLQSAMDEVDKSFESSATSEATSSLGASSSTTDTSATFSSATEVSASPSASTSQPPKVATDQTISDDLVKWQKKFAIAADKGMEDLKERIEEIVTGLVKDDLSEGKGLANALEKSSEVQLDTMKTKIKSVVSLLPDQAQSAETAAAENEITKAIHEAGIEIKTRATAVRTWHENYRQELKQRTELATESTLHVLDDIRDLGLQEIGMRWAWMEGVTYKHWRKYHELKKRFADWRSEVRDAALAHPALLEALDEAKKLWEESMGVTEAAAKELIRLKDVAKWKVAARDSSNDFDSRAVPVVAAAASAASSFASDMKDALVGSSQGTIESLSSVASSGVAEASQSASVAAADDQNPAASLLSDATSAVSPSKSGAGESVSAQAPSSGSSVASAVSSAVEEMGSSASSGLQTSSIGTLESVASSMSSGVSSAVSAGSEALDAKLESASDFASSIASSATAGPSDGKLSLASSLVDSVSSSASPVIDNSEASQSLLNAVNKAGEKATELTSSWKSE